jgi:hypothetical protein
MNGKTLEYMVFLFFVAKNTLNYARSFSDFDGEFLYRGGSTEFIIVKVTND